LKTGRGLQFETFNRFNYNLTILFDLNHNHLGCRAGEASARLLFATR
jgi:hypothetical protein